MKQLLKKKGIVLTSKEYKENARLLTILTENGLESSILKGASKINSKNKSFSIAPLLVEYVSSNTSPISTFIEAVTVNSYINIKTNQNKVLAVMAVIEKCLAFTENIDNKTMFFNFIISILNILDNTSYPNIVLNLFEIKLMYLLGIAPVLNKCVICNMQKDDYVLSIKSAGCLCNECSKLYEYELNNNLTKLYQYLYLIKIDKVDEKFLTLISKSEVNLGDWIDKYYEKYIDFRSKTKKIIKKVVI